MKKLVILALVLTLSMGSVFALSLGTVQGMPAVGLDLSKDMDLQIVGGLNIVDQDVNNDTDNNNDTLLSIGARVGYTLMNKGAISAGAFGALVLSNGVMLNSDSEDALSGVLTLGAFLKADLTEKVALITDFSVLDINMYPSAEATMVNGDVEKKGQFTQLGLFQTKFGILYTL